MPVVQRSNNRVLPANERNADVAEKAINEILAVQQQAYMAAFRPQGIQAIHYSRLLSGRKCNCQSAAKQINGILNQDGKASPGTINSLITGEMNFDVTPYNQNYQRVTGVSTETSPFAQGSKYQSVFDIATEDNDIPFADLLEGRPGFGDNGPVEPTTIDDIVGDFDASFLGFSDVACPICFGSGFVGGFTPYHAHRQVLTVPDVQLLVDSEINTLARPLSAKGSGFNVIVTLPAGAIAVDVFRVWNMAKPVNATISIDGSALTNVAQLLAVCDGKRHLISATNVGEFTHFEMQFTTTKESVYFEFPRRPTSNNTDLLEQMEPFNIIMSPNLPTLASMDVIVESQLGKILVVQNVNPWNTRNRNVLGWEAEVRVIQPQELFRILPSRGGIMNKNPTTNAVRDNMLGTYRT
jgi:hypothetical protein